METNAAVSKTSNICFVTFLSLAVEGVEGVEAVDFEDLTGTTEATFFASICFKVSAVSIFIFIIPNI